MKNYFIFLSFSFFFYLSAQAQIITTIAGNGIAGYSGDGGLAIHAELSTPIGVAVDGSGNVYISDRDSNRVRKVTTDGIITTIAGNGMPAYSGDGGPATAASVNQPYGIAIDGAGNLYICDDDTRVRKVNPAGIITTFAGGDAGYIGEGNGGPATAAALNSPINVSLDNYGNVYITESDGGLIRKVDTAGIITIVAGVPTSIPGDGPDGGQATATALNFPVGTAVDNDGNIYIAEFDGYRIRKVNTAGIITTVAGTGTAGYGGDGGPATAADIKAMDVAVDGAGNLFICGFSRIRKVDATGIISTVAGGGPSLGDGGAAVDCEVNDPNNLTLDAEGNMYIADSYNNRVRLIDSIATPVRTKALTIGALAVYPNPSGGQFITNIPSSINEHAEVTITNIAGEKIKELTIMTNKPVDISLDVPTGIYFISAVTVSGVYNKELIVNR